VCVCSNSNYNAWFPMLIPHHYNAIQYQHHHQPVTDDCSYCFTTGSTAILTSSSSFLSTGNTAIVQLSMSVSQSFSSFSEEVSSVLLATSKLIAS